MKALQSNTSKDEVKRMIEELDTDLDSFINLEEFRQILQGWRRHCGSRRRRWRYGKAEGYVQVV
ncbi:hypothetical protein ACSBR1_013471 [Camellia fascicularis]